MVRPPDNLGTCRDGAGGEDKVSRVPELGFSRRLEFSLERQGSVPGGRIPITYHIPDLLVMVRSNPYRR
ncbi:uncharacterized protein ColSpa_03567 [Colletotrichum spaethianum]|uniref:Uncharacterized protein n=1 Tax=Colletotrichum spaethianum TaxID=700344 RepID=A0AA37P5C2_9PEZI|nr:uncharacterized protein ColSpa_03567 [Colletotrichum spaethianum]GKT43386.1 hypothetical protein ColSpa_03567 [Colletotrichum spaethianum]